VKVVPLYYRSIPIVMTVNDLIIGIMADYKFILGC